MKTLLLALALAAAPLHAVETEGPSRGPAGVPAAGPQVQMPALPPAVPGLGVTGVDAGLETPPLSQPVSLPQGAAVGAPAAGAPSAVTGAAQAQLSAPEGAPQGAPEASKPGAAPQEGVVEGSHGAPKAVPAAAAPSSRSGKDGAQASGSSDKAQAPEVSAEAAKTQADAQFDGQGQQSAATPTVAAPKGFTGRVLARLGLARFTGAKTERPKTPFDKDNFGGPQKLELTRLGKTKYALRWGLSLTGIATLIQVGLGTLFSFFPWQLHLGKGLLTGAGRVELLTGAGPQALAQAIASHPLMFFAVQLPLMTLKEELVYRGIQFGLLFLVLSAIRPAAALAAGFVEKIPDLFGYERLAQRALKFAGKISAHAFSIAAVISAWHFAAAHFAAWGISPETIAVHGALGVGLAYIAYKTRSLATAFGAHLTYNLLSLGALALVVMASPAIAAIYGLGLSVVSVAALYLHWRSYRKAKGLATAQAKLSLKNGVASLMVAALLAGSLMGMGPRGAVQQASQRIEAPQSWTTTVPVQQAAPAPAPQAAPKATPPQKAEPQLGDDQIPPEAKAVIEQLRQALGQPGEAQVDTLEGLAAITAQAKQSVVEVINPGVGLGSGYVVSKDGLLLTNAHVANGAKNGIVIIKFENGMKGPAKVVAINTDKDIAIIQLPKLKNGDWPAIAIAQPNSVHEGDEVLAMGHPLGLPFTVTRGIVSGLGDRGNLFVEHLQTDAAINHGNSGGPLVNAKTGEVVGMDSEIASTNDGNMGLGFAITAKDLRDAIDQYRATGNINSSWLGVIINTTGEDATDRGVVIEQVRPGSPAAKAGLRPGDVILGADDQAFGEPKQALHQLAAVVAHTKPGQPLTIAVGRDGEIGVAKITLADKR